ncbi:hypothetical protein SLS55_007109 [Diplodia seriata]|uniref:Heterokaryon incompatibility domain-containing protein n=1 Tax=Diplodia seriata TaxID=420778 RepID=A0ABR3CCE1_9PEZI
MHLVDDLVDNIKNGAKNGADEVKAAWGVVNKNPEKMRALLNHMLTPRFKPTFVDRKPSDDVGFQLLGPASEETPSIPLRMFNIDTGNMMDGLDNDDVNQYCILSHSWKGAEVDLPYVNEAREHNRRKVVESKEPGAKSDIEMIMNLSREKIEEKKKTIEEMLKDKRPDADVGKILGEHIEVKLAKRNLKSATRDFADAKAKLAFAELEADAFRNLAKEMEKTISIDPCHSRPGRPEQLPQADEKDPGAEGLEKAKDALAKSQAELDQKTKQSEDVKPKADFLEHDDQRLLREAVEGLYEALQKWKSSIKIDQSVKRAQEIFDEGVFPAQEKGKRYLWNDTCCIDKKNQGELVDSLSLMGDWYANADFCLVHLDTPPSDDEWNDEWTRFSQLSGTEAVLPDPPNIDSYDDILDKEPKWSTRGWTLQELVLSKTTFYVNSAWKRLQRPQENLGPYYFLCPFIELYTRGKLGEDDRKRLEADREKLRKVWKEAVQEHHLKLPKAVVESDENDNATRTNAGQHLIAILEALEVHIPSGIDKETAIPFIDQVVYLAAVGMRKKVKEEDSQKFRLQNNLTYDSLKGYLFPNEERVTNPEDDPRRMVTILLHCLVAETKDAIVRDRRYIAKFGKVEPLESWQGGTARTSFSTHRVMSLACNRTTTVETDRAYSLMGLLGVRFPTFKAEGLPKALTRLFDEALISSNDVSVFNWTGREMGSHIRGRSLYPSRLEAFDTSRVEGQSTANKRLAGLLQTRRKEVMQTFHIICEMLQNTIRFIKRYDHHRHLPMPWIVGIVNLIHQADFDDLDGQVRDLEKILKWVENKCSRAWDSKGGSKKAPHLIGDGLLGLGDSAAELAKKPMKGLLGGLHKKRSISGLFDPSRSSKRVKTEDGRPASPTPSTADTLVDEPYDEQTLKGAVERLSKDVHPYLERSLTSLGEKNDGVPRRDKIPPLPAAVLDELTRDVRPAPAMSMKDSRINHVDVEQEAPDSMVSPNPIVVNSSGIEGVFDIQRVVVTFHEENRLWDQVAKAVSPRQRITGWCSISTGFARVMVSFSCARHVLARQLKIAQVVQKKVVGKRSKEGVVGTDSVEEVQRSEYREAAPSQPDERHKAQHTEDEKRVSDMIAFVQEESLEAIAGEWVLARFSDVAGAAWFLCALELGSTGSLYCGHRVATDKIDFADAIPEPGLINVWQAYMNRKKRKLCYILADYLRSRDMCAAKDIIFNHSELDAPGEDDNGDDDKSGNPLRDILDAGVTAVRNAGQLSVLSLREVWHDVKADVLNGYLTAAVLKYTPKELRSAVENLNADQDFLPAAFRSGTRVHMF